MEKEVLITDLINNKDYSKLDIITYLPIQTKMTMAETIAEKTMKVKNTRLIYDRNEQNILFSLICIAMHIPNLKLGSNDYNNYDMLKESGIMEELISKFQKDYDECSSILNIKIEDMCNEDNSIDAVIANNFSKIVNSVDKMLDRGDPNVMAKYLSKGIEKLADQLSVLDVKNNIAKKMGL